MQGAADALVSWGYVVLFVDSFSTRGIYHLCTPDKYAAEKAIVVKRPADAFGALRFLAAQPFVNSRRTAVVGFSAGSGDGVDDRRDTFARGNRECGQPSVSSGGGFLSALQTCRWASGHTHPHSHRRTR